MIEFIHRNRPAARGLRRALLTGLVAVLAAACGGGGGGSGDPGTPTGGGGTGGTTDTLPAPAGSLWHNSLATDSVKRSQVSSLAGVASRPVDANDTAVPSADGKAYAIFEYDFSPGARTTQVWVKDAGTGATRQTATFNGYVRDLRPSPVNPLILLVKWSSSATTNDPEQIIVDLAARKILANLAADDAAANWLPDGRYVLVDAAGAIFTGTPTGTRVAGGQIGVSGRKVRGLWVNPQGTQMLTLWAGESGDKVLKDLWVSDIAGGGLARLTATEAASGAVWSPDGKLVAFSTQPEVVCTGSNCVGAGAACELQYTGATLRGVTLGGSTAPLLRVRHNDGARTVILGCDLRGWTP